MEEYTIEIESKGEYNCRKEFKKVVSMNEREFLALTTAILDFFDVREP